MIRCAGDWDAYAVSTFCLAWSTTHKCLCGRETNTIFVDSSHDDGLALDGLGKGLGNFESLSIRIEMGVCSHVGLFET